MLQAKTFMALNDTAINNILQQVPDGSFKSLTVLGEYRPMGKNYYLLLMDVAEPIEIKDNGYFTVNIKPDESGCLNIMSTDSSDIVDSTASRT